MYNGEWFYILNNKRQHDYLHRLKFPSPHYIGSTILLIINVTSSSAMEERMREA